MNKFYLYIVCSLISYQMLGAVEFKEVLEEVLKTNPEILQKKQEYDMGISDVGMAKSGYKPKLDLKISEGREQTNSSTTNSKNNTLNPTTQSLTLTQNLFEGFATQTNLEVKRNKLKSLGYSYDEVVNDVLSKFVIAYIEILKNKELCQIEKENVTIHEKIYADVKMQIETGTGRTSNLKDVGSKLALSYSNLLLQENTYKDSVATFFKLLGRFEEGETFEDLKFDLNMPKSLDELLAKILISNPTILAQKEEVSSAKLELKLSKSNNYPKIDFEVSKTKSEDISENQEEYNTSKAMLSLTYNLYNGSSDEYKIQQYTSAVHKKIQALDSTRRNVLYNGTLAWNEYSILTQQIEYLTLYKNIAEEKQKIFQEEFELGRRALSELLDAADDFDNSRRKLVSSKYDIIKAKVKILESLGSVTESLLFNKNGKIIYNENENYNLDGENFDYSTDNDQVDNENDICQQSLENYLLNNGCKYIPTETKLQAKDFNADIKKYDSLGIEGNPMLTENTNIESVPEKSDSLNESTANGPKIQSQQPLNLETEKKIEIDLNKQVQSKYSTFNTEQLLKKLNIKNDSISDEQNLNPSKVFESKDVFSNPKEEGVIPKIPKKEIEKIEIPKPAIKTEDINIDVEKDFKNKFLNATPDSYTINLAYVRNTKDAQSMIKKYNLENNAFTFQFGENNEAKIFYGVYKTREEANQALSQLNESLQQNKPFVENILKKQQLYKKYND